MTIERTSKGLSEALFGELESLKNGEVTPQHARSFALVAKTVCAVTRLEMDFARFVSEGPEEKKKKIKKPELEALTMGVTNE